MKTIEKTRLIELEKDGIMAIRELENEINIQQRLKHKNIIEQYNCFIDTINVNIIMEYACNYTLFHFIRNKNYLPELQAFYFFTQVCDALHFMHSKGLIHRDIKPENLLIAEDGSLKLCDFGCCRDIKKEEDKYSYNNKLLLVILFAEHSNI